MMASNLVDICHAAYVNRRLIPCSQVLGASTHFDVDDTDYFVVYAKFPPSTTQFCLYLTNNSRSCNPLTHPPMTFDLKY
jgi:hypothetical protein